MIRTALAAALVFALGSAVGLGLRTPPAGAAVEPLPPPQVELIRLQVELANCETELKDTRAAQAELAKAQSGERIVSKSDEVIAQALAEHVIGLEAKRGKLIGEVRLAEKRLADHKPPTTACLVVEFGPEGSAYPFKLAEYGEKGRWVGGAEFTTTAALERTLARAAKDSAAPKELRVAVSAETPFDRVKEALAACKSAGFDRITFTGHFYVWFPRTGSTVPRVDYQAVTRKFDAEVIGIDKLLEQITRPQPKP